MQLDNDYEKSIIADSFVKSELKSMINTDAEIFGPGQNKRRRIVYDLQDDESSQSEDEVPECFDSVGPYKLIHRHKKTKMFPTPPEPAPFYSDTQERLPFDNEALHYSSPFQFARESEDSSSLVSNMPALFKSLTQMVTRMFNDSFELHFSIPFLFMFYTYKIFFF